MKCYELGESTQPGTFQIPNLDTVLVSVLPCSHSELPLTEELAFLKTTVIVYIYHVV